MKPLLLLLLAGCAFGQQANNPVCVDVNEKGTTVHYEHSWANYEGLSPAQIAPAYEKLPKCIWPTSAVVEITEPATKKPAVHAKPVIKKCSGLTGGCDVEPTEPAGRKPAKNVPCPPFGNGPCNWEAARNGAPIKDADGWYHGWYSCEHGRCRRFPHPAWQQPAQTTTGVREDQEPRLMAPAEATGRPLTPAEAAAIIPHDCTGRQEFRNGSCRDPEPIDVPAIQEMRHNGKIGFAKSDEECKKKGGSPMGEPGSTLEINGYCEDMLETVTTCADKERILEHSESGKYWCRRVQP